MLREQLRLENESHAQEMEEVLQDQAKELASEWSAQMDLKLLEQQGFYQTELARAKARLGGLEVMVDGVASAGEWDCTTPNSGHTLGPSVLSFVEKLSPFLKSVKLHAFV